MLVSLKDITNCEYYYIDDTTFQIVSFKQKKYTDGKILTPHTDSNGYIQYQFSINGKHKYILLHYIIVKLFIDKNFDPTIVEIDHKDRNKKNNSINNLAVVSRSENQRNRSSMNEVEFNYFDNIGKALVINSDAGIYYSLETDHFYMYIEHVNKYKELHVYLNHGKNPSIRYRYNNKQYQFSINKFKKSLKQEQ